MSITLENGVKVEGEFLELRISVDTIPEDKEWYQIRHSDEDWIEPVSLKRGGIMVNFMGTFICNPIESKLKYKSNLFKKPIMKYLGY